MHSMYTQCFNGQPSFCIRIHMPSSKKHCLFILWMVWVCSSVCCLMFALIETWMCGLRLGEKLTYKIRLLRGAETSGPFDKIVRLACSLLLTVYSASRLHRSFFCIYTVGHWSVCSVQRTPTDASKVDEKQRFSGQTIWSTMLQFSDMPISSFCQLHIFTLARFRLHASECKRKLKLNSLFEDSFQILVRWRKMQTISVLTC